MLSWVYSPPGYGRGILTSDVPMFLVVHGPFHRRACYLLDLLSPPADVLARVPAPGLVGRFGACVGAEPEYPPLDVLDA